MSKLNITHSQKTSRKESGPGSVSKSAKSLTDNRLATLAQRKQAGNDTVQKKSNSTGLPDNLKTGIENISGYSMDDVKVHYNSSKPTQLNAHAYAQGTDIHVASGQEKHLAHEAWHVVQQKQGRVQPTGQAMGMPVNTDVKLEKEADLMGSKALGATGQSSAPAQKKSKARGIKQFGLWDMLPIRWYEYDGQNYTGRTAGLASWTGWIKLEHQHEGKDVYVSITNVHRLPAVREVQAEIENIRTLVDEHAPLLRGMAQRVEHQAAVVDVVRQAQAEFVSFNAALGNYLTRTSTFFKLMGVVLGLTLSITAGVIISYLTLPAWLVGAVEGLSFLYGCGLLYRWSQSQLLPTMIKIGLLAVNIAVMSATAGLSIAQIIAYLTGLTATAPFQHIQFAAIPFALLIEHFIVVLLEKVNALRVAHNNANGHQDHAHNV